MAKMLEGDMTAGGLRFGIIVSRFNEFITERLLESALETLRRHGGDPEACTVARVPGSLEIPVVAHSMAKSGKFDAIITLGCIIRGATGHYDHVAGQAASGIAQASVQSGVPVIFGVITADTLEQAIERAGSKQGNTGGKSAIAAIEMANLMKKL